MDNEIKPVVIDKVLIYKRTHTGDPNSDGIFGIEGCMGQVRDWCDPKLVHAVIGIGVKKPDAGYEGIAEKITWIGITPTRHETQLARNPLVTFEKFCLLDTEGPFCEVIAPELYSHMFGDVNRRFVKDSLPNSCIPDIEKILKLAEGWPASKGDVQSAIAQFNRENKSHIECPSCGCHSQAM